MSEYADKLWTEASNMRLKAENAKLHAELTDLRLGSCPSCGIKVENERLREMCKDLVGELRGLGIDFTRVSWCEYADELRELGIEVEEW